MMMGLQQQHQRRRHRSFVVVDPNSDDDDMSTVTSNDSNNNLVMMTMMDYASSSSSHGRKKKMVPTLRINPAGINLQGRSREAKVLGDALLRVQGRHTTTRTARAAKPAEEEEAEGMNLLSSSHHKKSCDCSSCFENDTATTLSSSCTPQNSSASSSSSSSALGAQQQEKHTEQQEEQLQHKQQQQLEIVLVSGKSGTGKSTLVERTLRPDPNDRRHWLVSTKFDQLDTKEPFAAIIGAFSDICDLILQEDEEYVRRVRQDLLKEFLPEDIRILVQSIPSLSFLLNVSPNQQEDPSKATAAPSSTNSMSSPSSSSSSLRIMMGAGGGLEQAETRFQLLCRSFLQVCARHQEERRGAIVLFMDDCQWADQASLGVMQKLVVNSGGRGPIRHVLLVCAYRDDDPNVAILQDGFWQQCPQQPQQPQQQQQRNVPYRITNLPIGDLELESIVSVVHDLLPNFRATTTTRTTTTNNNKEEGEAKETGHDAAIQRLSQVVHRKTRGNAYFVVQYIDSLVVNGLLRFDLDDECWEWDIDRIQAETNVSENVADIVTSKIQRLPQEVQNLLQIAACMGHSFRTDLLESFVVQTTPTTTTTTTTQTNEDSVAAAAKTRRRVTKSMAFAETEGLVERKNKAEFKFTHDRVQQCLYDLLGESKQKKHLDIGTILKQRLESKSKDPSILYFIADQLNLGSALVVEQGPVLELFDYNLQCARLAKRQGAFVKAAEYLRAASAVLAKSTAQAGTWTPERWVDVQSQLAEVEFSLCNFDECRKAVHDVVRHTDSVGVKQAVYLTKVRVLGSEGNFRDAIGLAIDALHLSGFPFPRRPTKIQLGIRLIKTMRLMAQTPLDDIRALPVMEQQDKKMQAELLLAVLYYATLAENEEAFGLATLYLVQMALRHGLTAAGCVGLASYAAMIAILGRFNQAFQLGMVVLKTICRAEFSGDPQAITFVYGFVYHHRRPLTETVKTLHQSYQSAMQHSGYIESALLCGMNSSLSMYMCGVPLPEVEECLRDICVKLRDFRIASTSIVAEPFWQAVLNLMGESEDPLQLNGEALCQQDALQHARDTNNDMVVYTIRYHLVHLYGYLEAKELGERLFQEMKDKPKSHRALRCHFIDSSLQFFTGLLWCDLYRQSQKRRHRARALRMMRFVEKRVQDGNQVYIPILGILLAEKTTLGRTHNNNDVTTVIQAYQDAIDRTIDCEVPHYEAVANEKAGNALADMDKSAAQEYYSRALDLYERWGAQSLVDNVQLKLDMLR